jgi:hypothetical protein
MHDPTDFSRIGQQEKTSTLIAKHACPIIGAYCQLTSVRMFCNQLHVATPVCTVHTNAHCMQFTAYSSHRITAMTSTLIAGSSLPTQVTASLCLLIHCNGIHAHSAAAA